MFLIKRIGSPHTKDVKEAAVHGRFLITGSRDKTVAISDRNTGKVLLRTDEAGGFVNSLAVSPGAGGDAPFAIFAGIQTGEIVRYTVDCLGGAPQLRKREATKGHTNNVCSLKVHGRYLLSASWDGKVCVWRTEDMGSVAEISTDKTPWSAVVVQGSASQGTEHAPAEKFIVCGCTDGHLLYYKLTESEGAVRVAYAKSIAVHKTCIRDLMVKDGFLYSLSNNGVVMKSEASGKILEKVDTDTVSFKLCATADAAGPNRDGPAGDSGVDSGRLVFVSSDEGIARVFDGDLNEKETIKIPALSCWSACAAGPGELLLCGSDGRVYVYSASINESEKRSSESAHRELEALFSEARSDAGARDGKAGATDIKSTNPNYRIENGRVYQMIDGGWEMIGDVIKKDGAGEAGERKGYAHTIDIELGDRTMTLAFNGDEDHEDIAKRFVDENGIGPEYIDEIVEFLGKNFPKSRLPTTRADVKKRFYVYDTISLEGIKKKLLCLPHAEQLLGMLSRLESNGEHELDTESIDFLNGNIELDAILSRYIREEKSGEYFPALDCYKYLVSRGMKFDFRFMQTLDLHNEKKNCLVYVRLATNLIAFLPEAIGFFEAQAKRVFDKGLVDEFAVSKYKENMLKYRSSR